MVPVQVLKNPILILKSSIGPLGRILHRGQVPPLRARRGSGGGKTRRSRSGRESSVGGGAQRLRGGSMAGEHGGHEVMLQPCN